MHEQLQVVINVLLAANGGKPRPVARWPRPTSAVHRIRQKRRFEKHHDLVRRLLPD